MWLNNYTRFLWSYYFISCGATQTGFGRTGTVDWCTTAKTAPFTGVSGNGYFVNTTCGAVTVTLPATPTAGDIISIADYASTWQTNAVTLCRNSSKINGACTNANLTTQGQSITLVYVDGTRGWKNTMDSTSNVTGAPTYIVATGGTISCCGDYKIHTFTSDGTFTICTAPTPANNNVDYVVVAGGGGGGTPRSGAGGAGGYRESKNPAAPWTASPLASATSLPVSITAYPVTVGGGGGAGSVPGDNPGVKGSDSIFSTITSAGGGYGGDDDIVGGPGGSGGGGGGGGPYAGGSGNTPPTSPPQGNNGATTTPYAPTPVPVSGGGGGGATAAGSTNVVGGGGPGGAGATTSISATPTAYAGGGGGGGGGGGTGGTGGTGGGGAGGASCNSGTAGTINTGGGGGGAGNTGPSGGAGGSGIVIIRYKYQ
jgi:hypothetical protein